MRDHLLDDLSMRDLAVDTDQSVSIPHLNVFVRELHAPERHGHKIEQILRSTGVTLVWWVLQSAENRLLIESMFDAVHGRTTRRSSADLAPSRPSRSSRGRRPR